MRLLLVTPLLLAAPTFAQSFNLDVGANLNYPLPSNAYGAAANQPGQWAGVPTTAQSAVALTDLNGAATNVTITPSGGFGDFAVNNPAWSGDDALLMKDASDVGNATQGPPGGSITWTISGLADGDYEIYTYALAPDFPGFYTTQVDVQGAAQGPQVVGGNWNGSPHVLGVSYALHTVTVASGADVVIVTSTPATPANNLGTVNGFQIVGESQVGVAFCFGDGSLSTACPCGNVGSAGRGCDNSAGTGGAELVAAGTLSPDTVVLTSSFELSSALTIFLQGDALLANGVVFGDGVRCVGGSLKRIGVENAAGGVASYPGPGDPSITQQSANLGDPIAPGSTRWYQAYYRDPALGFCPSPPGASWNVSGGIQITWP